MSFDRLAPHYRWMEAVAAGGLLQRSRVAWLDSLAPPRSALIYGEGNGRFLCELLRRFPAAHITCVDTSPAMLSLAQARLRHAGLAGAAVEWICADAREWLPPSGCYDLIVTHYFLDCFPPEDLATLIPRIATAATPRAAWLVADFRPPPRGLRGWRQHLILRLLYIFFRAMTGLTARRLTVPDPHLTAAGFHLTGRRDLDWGLLHSDLWVRG